MPRVALSQQEVDDFRERATSIAMHRLADRGFRELSMRALARELGCSAMALYRYFDSKEELLVQVRTQAFRQLAESQEAAAAGIADPIERTERLGRSLIDFALQRPDAYSVMFELEPDTTVEHPELEQQSHRAWVPMRTATGDAIEAGFIDGDADTMANLLFAAMHGLLSMHLSGRLQRGRTLEDLLEPMMQLLSRGVAAAPTETDAPLSTPSGDTP